MGRSVRTGEGAPVPSTRRLRAVSIGGGTGQPNLVRALRRLDCAIDSIVAMADDGGSTGILRERAHIVPPGDVRKCLSALAADEGSPIARAFAHRFPYVEDHALGNLVLTALAEETGSFVEAVRECERVLGCVGHVHPSTLDDVTLAGRAADGRVLRGQAALSYGDCALERVWLEPAHAEAYAPAVEAIMGADLVVLGPGSLFTSIIPNVLVDGILEALRATDACVAFVCPKADRQGETRGLSADEYVDALVRHGLGGVVDVALVHRAKSVGAADGADPSAPRSAGHVDPVAPGAPPCAPGPAWRDVRADDAALERIRAQVPRVLVRDFSDGTSSVAHDRARLADAFSEVIAACRLPRR